jgi:hypothetical protein
VVYRFHFNALVQLIANFVDNPLFDGYYYVGPQIRLFDQGTIGYPANESTPIGGQFSVFPMPLYKPNH